MDIPKDAVLLRIFFGEMIVSSISLFMKLLCRKPAKNILPVQQSLEVQWGLGTPVGYIPPKSYGYRSIFLS